MKQFLNALLSVLGFLWSVISDYILEIIDLLHQKRGFDAEWGRETKIASRWNEGFVISKYRKITVSLSQRNVLLCANTGAGKTTSIIVPSVFELVGNSMIINDGGDVFENTSGYISQHSDIKVIDLSNSETSNGFNFISSLSLEHQSDIEKTAFMLAQPKKDSKSLDDFWETKTKEVYSILIRLALYQAPELQNIQFITESLKLLIADPEAIDLRIVQTGDEKLLLDYKVLISNSDKVFSSILSGAKASISPFEDPHLAKIASYDDIRFSQLREKPTVIYLRTNPALQDYHAKFIEIFFSQFYSYILGAGVPPKGTRPIFCIIDEASSLLIHSLATSLAVCRKFFVGTMICIQNHQQLEKLYGKDSQNIVQNCVTKIYLSGQSSSETLRELEMLAGKTRRKNKRGNEVVENLISSDAIRCLPANRSLIISGNTPVIKGRIRPFFKSRKYRMYAQIPPLVLRSSIPDEPLHSVDTQEEEATV